MRDDEPIDRQLEGWGTPSPAPDFADRVVVRVSRPPRRGIVLAFALGAAVGGLGVGAAAFVGRGSSGSSRAELDAPTHVAIPGVGDVITEPGARVHWTRGGGGEVVVEVERGIAWVRRASPDAAFVVVADGDAIDLAASACARIEVSRGLLRVDVTDDAVDCGEIDAAIVRAEPSGTRSR